LPFGANAEMKTTSQRKKRLPNGQNVQPQCLECCDDNGKSSVGYGKCTTQFEETVEKSGGKSNSEENNEESTEVED